MVYFVTPKTINTQMRYNIAINYTTGVYYEWLFKSINARLLTLGNS